MGAAAPIPIDALAAAFRERAVELGLSQARIESRLGPEELELVAAHEGPATEDEVLGAPG